MKRTPESLRLLNAKERKLVYREAGHGILFIGTHHDSLNIIPRAEVGKLKAAVERMDILFFEGNRIQFNMESEEDQRVARTLIETLAYEHHKGESAFLDDLNQKNYAVLAKKYGLRPFAYAGLRAYDAVLSIVKMGVTRGGEVCTIAERILERTRRYTPYIYPFDNCGRMAAAATEAAMVSEHAFGSLEPAKELDLTAGEFLAGVRDKEVYGPLISGVVAKADGRKGVVIGSKHIDNLVSVLNGGNLDIPDWQARVERMSDNARAALKMLTDVLTRPLV